MTAEKQRPMLGVWLPFFVGLLAFLGLAAVALTLPVRSPGGPSQVAVDSRQESTTASAAAIGRSANGWVRSLNHVASVLERDLAAGSSVSLKPFVSRQRSALLVVRRSTRTVIAQLGEPSMAATLPRPLPDVAGLRPVEVGGRRAVLGYRPVGSDHLLVGAYDPDTLAADLLATNAPARAWLVDGTGNVLTASDPAARQAALPVELADAAHRATDGEAGNSTRWLSGPYQLTTWASVTGTGPAADTRWAVLSTTEVAAQSAGSLGTAPRRWIVVAGLGGVTLLVFGWLYLALLRPLAATRQAARRLASGERNRAVPPAGRFGEYATIARSLDRIRLGEQAVPGRMFRHGLLAWAGGLAAFLLLAGWLVLTRPSPARVAVLPGVVAEQQARTGLAANHVRRSLNGGLSDLRMLAVVVAAAPGPDQVATALARLVKSRHRYAGAALVRRDGTVAAKAGSAVDVTALPTAVQKPVLLESPLRDGRPHVLAVAPMGGKGDGRLVVEFRPEVLMRALDLAGPGTTRLVGPDNRVRLAGGGFVAFRRLERTDLQAAVTASKAGSTVSDGGRQVVTWAPVADPGPVSTLNWTVVTDRAWDTLAAPEAVLSRAMGNLAALIAACVLVIFGWLYAGVVGPLGGLARAAARLSGGDDRDPIVPRRYDQLGLLARDLERLRRGPAGEEDR